MASPTQWTWVWVSKLWELVMDREACRVRHDWATELNWTESDHFMTPDLLYLPGHFSVALERITDQIIHVFFLALGNPIGFVFFLYSLSEVYNYGDAFNAFYFKTFLWADWALGCSLHFKCGFKLKFFFGIKLKFSNKETWKSILEGTVEFHEFLGHLLPCTFYHLLANIVWLQSWVWSMEIHQNNLEKALEGTPSQGCLISVLFLQTGPMWYNILT